MHARSKGEFSDRAADRRLAPTKGEGVERAHSRGGHRHCGGPTLVSDDCVRQWIPLTGPQALGGARFVRPTFTLDAA